MTGLNEPLVCPLSISHASMLPTISVNVYPPLMKWGWLKLHFQKPERSRLLSTCSLELLVATGYKPIRQCGRDSLRLVVAGVASYLQHR